MRHFKTLAELAACVGQDVAVSDWIAIDQERIDRFADATGDHQWIHVDPERARQGPFGAPIAHGFLTLSLLPRFFEAEVAFPFARMSINYGTNKVRFPSPLRVGRRIRGRFSLLAVERHPDCTQSTWKYTVEQEGGDKPACVAEVVLRQYF